MLKIVSATRRGYRLCLHQLQYCHTANTACCPVADTLFSVVVTYTRGVLVGVCCLLALWVAGGSRGQDPLGGSKTDHYAFISTSSQQVVVIIIR